MRIFAQGWSNGFDGPGRRWVYYLKGCNFRCSWCANPESISSNIQMLFYPEKSKFAGESCPYGAVRGSDLDREKCASCEDRPCINHWCDTAFEISGRDIATDQILDEVESRRDLFGSDGGVTFSGGEPTLQMDELLEAAKALRDRGIHVTVETNASSPRFAELTDAFDLIICDLKCVSPELHVRMTGVDNQLVLKNIASDIPKTVRIPAIKELNFTPEEQDETVAFLNKVKPTNVEVLPLHQLGFPKYKALGLKCEAEDLTAPSAEEIEEFEERLKL